MEAPPPRFDAPGPAAMAFASRRGGGTP